MSNHYSLRSHNRNFHKTNLQYLNIAKGCVGQIPSINDELRRGDSHTAHGDPN